MNDDDGDAREDAEEGTRGKTMPWKCVRAIGAIGRRERATKEGMDARSMTPEDRRRAVAVVEASGGVV